MRKRYRVVLLAVLVATIAAVTTAAPVTSPAFGSIGAGGANFLPVPDTAKLVVVGAMLFGLAAFLRQAN